MSGTIIDVGRRRRGTFQEAFSWEHVAPVDRDDTASLCDPSSSSFAPHLIAGGDVRQRWSSTPPRLLEGSSNATAACRRAPNGVRHLASNERRRHRAAVAAAAQHLDQLDRDMDDVDELGLRHHSDHEVDCVLSAAATTTSCSDTEDQFTPHSARPTDSD